LPRLDMKIGPFARRFLHYTDAHSVLGGQFMRAIGYLFVLVLALLTSGTASAQESKGWLGADVLDVTKAESRGHSFYRNGTDMNVFCFAEREHAERFREHFGGELIDPKVRPSVTRVVCAGPAPQLHGLPAMGIPTLGENPSPMSLPSARFTHQLRLAGLAGMFRLMTRPPGHGNAPRRGSARRWPDRRHRRNR
jgi:hypothetical protein